MQHIRQPAVAGSFYPARKETLVNDVNVLLAEARMAASKGPLNNSLFSPKAIIVPHAGYIYSGPTAAAAFSRLAAVYDTITRVILLGPVHRVPVRGLALPGADVFATPLGNIQIDQSAVQAIKGLSQVVECSDAHTNEHSLEVQLPFLQLMLANFELLPLAVGDASPQEVAEVLNLLWGGAETLIVISSDLSHFLPYQMAVAADAVTAQNILQLRSTLNHQQACGGTPVNGFLLAAKQHRLYPSLLDLRNSGDTAGDKKRVVGYASFAFTEEQINVSQQRH